MATKICMPKLGMEMTEGAVTAWFFKEGERVQKGDVVVQVETEKITYDVEAPVAGVLRKIFVGEGITKPVGDLLAVITTEDETLDEREFMAQELAPAAEQARQTVPASTARAAEVASLPPSPEERVIASPAARRLAREKGIDLATVVGTGAGGRITERDVLAAAEAREKPVEAPLQEPAVHLGATIPLARIRGVIAERLTKSWEAPHIYLATEVDATEMVRLREELLPAIERETGQKLTYNDLLIKVVALGIEKHPILNGTFEAYHIKIPGEINIGLAVALEDGLVVPVVRRANQKSLAEVVSVRAGLVSRARARKLQVDELHGGTFTVSNLGAFEVDFFTAILNPPQSGILAVGRMKDTPVVIDGEVRVKPVMKLVLGVDHRVVDGAVAAAFLQDMKEMLENPRVYLSAG